MFVNALTVTAILSVLFLWLYREFFLRMIDRLLGRIPPGPTAFPILGTISINTKRPDLTFSQWSRKYGKIFSFFLGERLAIVIADQTIARQIYKDDRYSGRSHGGIGPHLDFDKGLVLNDGELWKEQRRFSLSALRDFGFGKAAGIECIQNETTNLLNFMRDQKGNPFDPKKPLANAVSNVIAFMLFSNTFQKQDKTFNMFVDHVSLNIKEVLGIGALEVFPWKRFEGVVSRVAEVNVVLSDLVREHRKSFDPKHPRDYIDAFFCMAESGSSSAFREEQLVRNLGDLYIAGFETTTTFLRWALMYMIQHPELQRKVQKEIDSTIGQSRYPEYTDKKVLPYTEAVTLEVFRMSAFVPLSLPHSTTEDVVLEGYHLPKGTDIFTPFCFYYSNPDVWGDPENFRPERFINSNGELVQKLTDEIQPFSYGKRACLGEPLARMEVFMFFASILQHFTVSAANAPLDTEPDIGAGMLDCGQIAQYTIELYAKLAGVPSRSVKVCLLLWFSVDAKTLRNYCDSKSVKRRWS